MDIEGYSIPENLLYTAEHDWIRIENDKKTILLDVLKDCCSKYVLELVFIIIETYSN